jgi:hypothetical protein
MTQSVKRTVFRSRQPLIEECALLLQAIRNNPDETMFPLLRRYERCLSLRGLTPSERRRVRESAAHEKRV